MGQGSSKEWQHECSANHLPTMHLAQLADNFPQYRKGELDIANDFLLIPSIDRIYVMQKFFEMQNIAVDKNDPLFKDPEFLCKTMATVEKSDPQIFWGSVFAVLEAKTPPAFKQSIQNGEKHVIVREIRRSPLEPDEMYGISYYLGQHRDQIESISIIQPISSVDGAYLMHQLCKVLPEIPHLKILRIGHNLKDDGIFEIAKVLPFLLSLEELNLFGNKFTDVGCQTLAEAIIDHPTIHSLTLSNNDNIGDRGAISLSTLFPRLIDLHINGTNIGWEGVMPMANQLRQKNNSLYKLSLEENNVGEKGAEAIGNALSTNESLHTLRLRFNNIGPRGIFALFTGLLTNTTLSNLMLSYNPIGKNGPFIIGDALGRNIFLRNLQISNCGIDDEGFSAICRGLEPNTHLQIFECDSNSLTPLCIPAFAKMLQHNRGLKQMSVYFTAITQEGADKILEALNHNHTLLGLWILVDEDRVDVPLERFQQNIAKILKKNKKRANAETTRLSAFAHDQDVEYDLLADIIQRAQGHTQRMYYNENQ